MSRRPPRRVPRSRWPNGSFTAYLRTLRGFLLILEELQSQEMAVFNPDDVPSWQDLNAAIERMQSRALQVFNQAAIDELARQFVDGVRGHVIREINRQVKAVTGQVPMSGNELLEKIFRESIRANVDLIKTIPERHFGTLRGVLAEGIREGRSIGSMARPIRDVGGATERWARFIARDQTGKLYGDMTKARHSALGLRSFIWRTSLDERVRGNPDGKYPPETLGGRPNHWSYEGKRFTWAEGTPEGLWPGRDYNCRCTGEPVPEEILAVAESGLLAGA